MRMVKIGAIHPQNQTMILKDSSVVFLDGVRTPFMKSPGPYLDLKAYDLARMALKSLKDRHPLLEKRCDQVSLGCVIQNAKTSNVAREALIGAGYDLSIPAYTVTQACISANRAICNTVDALAANTIQVAIAGGVESLSDAPIRISHELKKIMMQAQKAKAPGDYLKLLRAFKLRHLKPEAPAIAEFSTGVTMGQDADRLAARFGVTRKEQDAFALRSHQLAAKAWEDGVFTHEVTPVLVPEEFTPLERDNTIYADTSMEKLAKLKPVFVKPHGTITAGNASPITDGASATMLSTLEWAKAEGYRPQVAIAGYAWSAQDPDGELLLGPAFTIPTLLNEAGLSLNDISVFELHEAFAGQVLANLRALNDKRFCTQRLGLKDAFGEIPMDLLNTQGGSLSLGHPFGATGGRLLIAAARRLVESGGEFALISACAAGAQGNSILLKRID